MKAARKRISRAVAESLERRTLLSLAPVGTEFRVNSFTSANQLGPAVGMDANRNFVVTWQSFSQDAASTFGIYAQRYNAAGEPQGAEFRVNTTTAGGQLAPAVAMDADGDFVIAWQGNGPGDGYGIFAQRYNSAGVAQGVEFRANSFTTGTQRDPSVAMDASGNFVIAWHSAGQDPGGSLGVYAQRFNSAGLQQGVEFRVNTFTTGDQRFADVAMDANGDFVVAWSSDGQDASGQGIYAQRYDAAGVAQGSEIRVNTFTTGDQLSPAVAIDADGDFVVTWTSTAQDESNYGVYGQRFNAAGAPQGAEFRANTYTTGHQFLSEVELDGDGDFVVTWASAAQDGSDYGVYGQSFNAAGVPQDEEFRINSFTNGSQARPAVAMDAGHLVIAWQSFGQDGSGYGVYAQRYMPAPGPPVGGADRLMNNNAGATNAANFTQSSAVVVAFGDTVVAAFDDSGSFAGANKFTGFSRSTNGGVDFVDGGTLPTNPNGDAGFPVLARDATTGRIYLATLEFFGSGMNVFHSDDAGMTWSLPAQGMPGKTGSQDKGWIAVDNFAGAGNGNVYLLGRDFGAGNGIYLFRSTDQGVTFGPSGGTLIASGGATNVHGGFVAVGPDHAVNVFYFDENSVPERIMMRRSTDRGVSFGAAVVVATLGTGPGFNGDLGLTGIRQGTDTPVSFRTNSFPQAAVNPVSGHLYVTYSDNPAGTDKADIFLVQSTTAGASWSAPVRVNDDATTTDQWMPTIAVLPDGTQLGVFYYSRQEDTANNQFRYYGRIATLSGGPSTFGPSSAISDVPSLPEFGRDNVVNSTYMGVHNAAFATPGTFHVVWSDSRDNHPLPGGAPRKDPNVYYDTIATDLRVTASDFLFETSPHRLTFTFSQNVAASLGSNDVILENLTTMTTIPSAQLTLNYNAATNVATFSYTGSGGGISGVLPNGRYRATLLAAGVTNTDGIALAANHVLNFVFLSGDADNDGDVDVNDLGILASNWQQSPRTFSQGNFDYSPDGLVAVNDLGILASHWQQMLASPSPAPRSPSVTTTRRGATVRPIELLDRSSDQIPLFWR